MWNRGSSFGARRTVTWLAAGAFPFLSAGYVHSLLVRHSFCDRPSWWLSPGLTSDSATRGRATQSEYLYNSQITILASSAKISSVENDVTSHENSRLKQTAADQYYAKNGKLPRPSEMHAVLPVDDDEQSRKDSKNILVIGDVHGCMEELQRLLDKAVRDRNDGLPFAHVILVGDLCNKGPRSAQVIRWARTTPNVWSVRGNHDDAALAAALGDNIRRSKKKYQWVLLGEGNNPPSEDIALSDDDVAWLADLPYTLTIPGSYIAQEEDVLIVHAGLIPGLPLKDQSVATMVTIREVLPICANDAEGISHFEYNERIKGNPAQASETLKCNFPVPWASAWKGPQCVIFGHDARRGFQRYDGDYAIGLDTGAVYGNQLTGMVLPGKAKVSVQSSEYSRGGKDD